MQYMRGFGMFTSRIRQVGGSLMLALPAAAKEMLHFKAGTTVSVSVQNNRLLIEPQRKKSYTLKQLLSECGTRRKLSAEEREWLSAPRVGRELL
jgi:antitoxin ChpS